MVEVSVELGVVGWSRLLQVGEWLMANGWLSNGWRSINAYIVDGSGLWLFDI